MHPKRRAKVTYIVLALTGLGLALGLALYAFKQNINLYFTPVQLLESDVPPSAIIRLGGMVKTGSIVHAAQGLKVNFVVTDFNAAIPVDYEGVLPDLFREQQGVVVQGTMDAEHQFHATTVLAKHDENYRPPHLDNRGGQV